MWRGNFSRRGDVALGASDGSVTVWKAETGWAPMNLQPHRRSVAGAAFTPDGRILATGGQEGMAKLWDLTTKRELATLKGHLRSIWALDISPDGSRSVAPAGQVAAEVYWRPHYSPDCPPHWFRGYRQSLQLSLHGRLRVRQKL